ncbi:MAG: nuclear transport factor 2 family protein [Burkholderiaceae bacterium]
MVITEICTAMKLYFDVMHECDLEKFDRIFHPTSSLFTAKDGVLTLRPFTQYRAEIEKRTSPKSLEQPREEAVLSINVLSSEIALVQVRVRIFEKIFIDNLNLLKIDGRWMIVAKIYYHADTIGE